MFGSGRYIQESSDAVTPVSWSIYADIKMFHSRSGIDSLSFPKCPVLAIKKTARIIEQFLSKLPTIALPPTSVYN
jgi:hypothetical protein